jgi:polyhydroxybutyrate depolymerase
VQGAAVATASPPAVSSAVFAPSAATTTAATRPAAVTTTTTSATLALPVARAAGADPDWTTSTQAITVDHLDRSYVVMRPPRPSTTPLPVLVVLHGHNATVDLEETRTAFPTVVGAAILVYPVGQGKSWNAGACCSPARDQGVDDVKFITAVVKDVLKSQPDASTSDVYLAGYSNGGKMAYRMACAEPGLFAGIASVGAVAVIGCAHPRAVTVLQVAYDGDPELTLQAGKLGTSVNGFSELSVPDQVARQRRVDACHSVATTQHQGLLTLTTWSSCAHGDEVALALYHGVDHSWPVGNASTASAAQLIWAFFRSLPAASRK